MDTETKKDLKFKVKTYLKADVESENFVVRLINVTGSEEEYISILDLEGGYSIPCSQLDELIQSLLLFREHNNKKGQMTEVNRE